MSRTYRHKRPKAWWIKESKVRDGVCQYTTWGCAHHGSCKYCENNRTFSTKKRNPLPFDEVENDGESD